MRQFYTVALRALGQRNWSQAEVRGAPALALLGVFFLGQWWHLITPFPWLIAHADAISELAAGIASL